MTEQEAKTKWCPLVRFGRDGCNVDGRSGRDAAMCIGSACMMWCTTGVAKYQEGAGGRCGLVREVAL